MYKNLQRDIDSTHAYLKYGPSGSFALLIRVKVINYRNGMDKYYYCVLKEESFLGSKGINNLNRKSFPLQGKQSFTYSTYFLFGCTLLFVLQNANAANNFIEVELWNLFIIMNRFLLATK